MHAFELGCERTWRKAHWRTSHGIPTEAPCLGILSESGTIQPSSAYPAIQRGSVNVSRLSMLEPIIQEVRWRIPGLGLGVLATGCHAAESLSSLASQTLPFFATETAMDPSETLNWICGVDVWLVASELPIASALSELADYLRIPCVKFVLGDKESRHARKLTECSFSCDDVASSPVEIATELSRWFEVSQARLPMLAFRSPRTSSDSGSPFATMESGITVDAALEILDIALSDSMQSGVTSVPSIVQTALRPAA
jgi:hypothetical protein